MKKIIILVFIVLPLLSFAQATDSIKIDYQPKVSGMIKSKWEHSFEDNTSRFDVRNSRIGFSGNINSVVSYKMQIEYSNHGEFVFLDACGVYKPLDNLSFYFGQYTLPFSDDHIISPSLTMFANRTFVAKFINPNSREVGARVDYEFSKKVPFTLQAGIFNGTGINNPKWQDSPFYLARLIYGTMDGFRASVKYYGGKAIEDKKVANYGVDLRYAKNRYRIETEYVLRDSIDNNVKQTAAYLQAAYSFPINNCKLIKYIEPTLRGDGMGSEISKGFDISRLTLGINFGLNVKQMSAEIRLNYENFFLNRSESEIMSNGFYASLFERSDKGLADKFTIEFLIKF